jgi:hypothetical protein
MQALLDVWSFHEPISKRDAGEGVGEVLDFDAIAIRNVGLVGRFDCQHDIPFIYVVMFQIVEQR